MKSQLLTALSIIMLIPFYSNSQSSITKTAGSVITGTGSNEYNIPWLTPGFAAVSDDQYARYVDNDSYVDNASYALTASQFGFNIPAGSIITGVEVAMEIMAFDGTNGYEHYIQLTPGGVGAGDNKTYGWQNAWPPEDDERVWGDANDTWNVSLGSATVNNPNFGVALGVKVQDGGELRVDAISITVYFTPPVGMAISQDGGGPHSSAMLDIRSTHQGLLLPRMTSSERNAITPAAEGLLIYDITLQKPCYYTGTSWQTISVVAVPAVPEAPVSREEYQALLKLVIEQQAEIESLKKSLVK